MKRILKRVAIAVSIALLAIVAWAIWSGTADLIYRVTIGYHRYETVAPQLPASLNDKAILVFSKTNGFRDEAAIQASNAALVAIGERRGWSTFVTENAAVFNAEQLKLFKAVVWNNTSGDLLTDDQRAVFKQYLEQGGGFIGIHGAGGDPSYKWSWYVQTLIGAQFIGHTMKPQFQSATVRIEDAGDSITQGLPTEWVRTDEWYSFANSPRAAGIHILATLDEKTYSPHMFSRDVSMGSDHPIIWRHCVVNGRAFYSALGHSAATYEEPLYLGVLERAIAWAAGFDGTQCQQGAEVH
ncbi:MAG TPA: ThuA domain-containing protein [Spongiibacteraceae bacterium]|nr:ThuA domain-containing protein [Spongiibacteraceae bacterium]